MFNLLRAELRRLLIHYQRYPLDFLSGILIMFITFFALVTGAQYIAGTSQFGSELDNVIIGYWLWTMAVFALNGTAADLQLEARAGVLEQLYLSSLGPLRVFLARSVAGLGVNILASLILLLVMLYLTGRQLSFPPILLVPFLCVLLGTYGLGLMMGALAILFKQIGRFLGLFQFALLAFVLVPTETWEGTSALLGYLMPIAPAAGLLRDLMVHGHPLDTQRVVFALVNASLYFVAGLLLFRQADREARRLGLLGQY